MHYIGIDMSKDNFHAAFSDEEVLIFENSKSGIEEFIENLTLRDYVKYNTVIGTESTGAYHLLLSEMLRSKGWNIKVINPLVAHKIISSTLRRLKTDKHDAIAIRKALVTGAGYTYTDTPEVLVLKALVQEREALVKVRASIKQRVHTHKLKEKASALRIGNGFTRVLKVLSSEIGGLEKEMLKYLPLVQNLLRTIPGIGTMTACALVAYIGLDPRVHESGTSIKGKGFISKRGNRYLRRILFNSAFVARRSNPEMEEYYLKKKGEGKHHFSILCAIERKLIHLIYAVWKRGTPFEARYLGCISYKNLSKDPALSTCLRLDFNILSSCGMAR